MLFCTIVQNLFLKKIGGRGGKNARKNKKRKVFCALNARKKPLCYGAKRSGCHNQMCIFSFTEH